MKPVVVLPAVFAALASVVTASASAQPATRLTLGGFNGNMGNTTVAQFDQGFKDSATGRTFTVQITAQNTIRTTSVFIRANSATMTGGKPVGDCQWRRNDLGAWNALTTTNALIETRVIQTNGTSWNNSVFFRCNLSWTSDSPQNYSVGLTFTLQVTP